MIRVAVADSDYASASEVVRDSLRDWKTRREIRNEEFAALEADIDKAFIRGRGRRLTGSMLTGSSSALGNYIGRVQTLRLTSGSPAYPKYAPI